MLGHLCILNAMHEMPGCVGLNLTTPAFWTVQPWENLEE
jgi:hypothetical protein